MEGFSSSGLQLQERLEVRSTTVRDIPSDCLDMILERLSIVDGYKGWVYLSKPNDRESQFDTPSWLLAEFRTHCFHGLEEVDDKNDGKRSGHSCSLLFYEPMLGKQERLDIMLKDGIELPGCHPSSTSVGRNTDSTHGHNWFAADKGLLLFNVSDRRNSRRLGNRFVVLNVINRSMSVLPPVHVPSFCRHEASHEAGCCNWWGGIFACAASHPGDCRDGSCRWECSKTVPLKLVVETGQTGGLKTTASSSFKAFAMQWTRQIEPLAYARQSTRQCEYNATFRVVVYDSITKLWTHTGAEWIGTGLGISLCARIFLTSNGIFVSTPGSKIFVRGELCDSFHDIMYKFENGRLVGQTRPPYELLSKYCPYCWEQRDDRDGNRDNGFTSYTCGCISTTVFEAEGKIFFFKQTSWIGSYGPNCISAEIWELDCTKTMWRKLSAGPMHLLQACPRNCRPSYLANITFTYNGILFVIRPGSRSKGPDYITGFDYIAGWDIAKKTWCKVPETILDNLPLPSGTFLDRNLADVDNYGFQPSVDRRVGL